MAEQRPRITCPVCGRTVSARLDGTPWAHRPPLALPGAAVPGGNCKGGYREVSSDR